MKTVGQYIIKSFACILNIATCGLFNRLVQWCTSGKSQPKAKTQPDDVADIIDLHGTSSLTKRHVDSSSQTDRDLQALLHYIKNPVVITPETLQLILEDKITDTYELQYTLEAFATKMSTNEEDFQLSTKAIDAIIKNGKIQNAKIGNTLAKRLILQWELAFELIERHTKSLNGSNMLDIHKAGHLTQMHLLTKIQAFVFDSLIELHKQQKIDNNEVLTFINTKLFNNSITL